MGKTLRQLGKAQLSAATATALDYAVTAFLFRFVGFSYGASTLCGTASGGLLNCAINYYWTFSGNNVRKRNVLFKYLVTWLVSIVLNTEGTVWMTALLEHTGMPAGLSTLMTARIIVSVLVAVLWNFLAQKFFVYRRINIKKQ
ncbi:MAG: GtrA family protein [Bacteroidaceae bacterium]|nr:GtrA family protein [Bacteroidaceae bacterium]